MILYIFQNQELVFFDKLLEFLIFENPKFPVKSFDNESLEQPEVFQLLLNWPQGFV